MYPQRISRSFIIPQTNLRNILLRKPNKLYEYVIQKSILNIRKSKNMSTTIQHLIRKLHFNIFVKYALPNSFKDQSANLLRVWAHQCECVVVQRLRRSQQMISLYSRMWGEGALKDLLRNMKLTFYKKNKELMLGAIGISTYNWEDNRLPEAELKKYLNDLDYINKLKEKTICSACDPSSKEKPNSAICNCNKPGQVDTSKSFENWFPFLEKQDLVVWRKMHESGSYVYKVFGSYADVSAEDFLNVQVDNSYRKKWDTTAVILETAETDEKPNSNSDIIYWEMQWPRLFANRDYVYNRRYLVDESTSTLVILSKSTVHSKYPKRTDTYRVEDYWSRMVIKPYTEIDKPGVEFCLTYYDNPGVNIPSSVTNWVAMRAMPDFLDRLREATRNYKEYCIKEGISEACKIIKERIIEDTEFLDFCSCNQEPIILSKKLNGIRKKKKNRKTSDSILNTQEGMESPAATSNQADSYWKYLHPYYYFH
ncbi:unnamed protein product [Brassicogethes aeneus]|uniref:Phosphatidylcholine transfer protein n=1 Tax=Brassicogethes aeneus TaxID=1431903 RepID=A0A9P0B813_BRAAE|nr:unnamed protein product [Brassicogethes aeneus]